MAQWVRFTTLSVNPSRAPLASLSGSTASTSRALSACARDPVYDIGEWFSRLGAYSFHGLPTVAPANSRRVDLGVFNFNFSGRTPSWAG